MALEFDAAGSNPDGTNPGSALVITDGTVYGVTAHAFPAPPVQAQWAASVDTEGSAVASVKHENRNLSLTVHVQTAAGLRALEAKAAKIIRERGTLKWTLPNSEVIIFDLLVVDQFNISTDEAYYVNTGAYCVVQMEITAQPYGRMAEVDLGDNTETTLPALVFTDSGVKGDVPGLGRLVVDNDQGSTQQKTMIWGVESRTMSSGVPLFVEAENATYVTPQSPATTVAGPAGASGGGSNVVRHSALAQDEAFVTYAQFTSVGTFNIYARVLAPAANAGAISVRMSWGNLSGQGTAYGNWIALDPAQDDAWIIVKLGQANPTARYLAPTAGSWFFTVNAKSTDGTGTDDLNVDCFFVVPVAEGSGELFDADAAVPSSGTATNGGVIITHQTAVRHSNSDIGRPAKYEGSYLLVPPAGAEARSVRFIVKMSRGEIQTATGQTLSGPDSAIDDISARLFYTPRYLVVPTP